MKIFLKILGFKEPVRSVEDPCGCYWTLSLKADPDSDKFTVCLFDLGKFSRLQLAGLVYRVTMVRLCDIALRIIGKVFPNAKSRPI